MIDRDLSKQDHLISAKERLLGSIQNDRGVELSEIDYLTIEIKETKEKRRTNSQHPTHPNYRQPDGAHFPHFGHPDRHQAYQGITCFDAKARSTGHQGIA